MGRSLIAPRMLTKEQAAVYCGLGVGAFEEHCPVLPAALGPDPRHRRYDVRLLDAWLDGFRPQATPAAADGAFWLQHMENVL